MSRKAWRGTAEAAAIGGVSKPSLLHRIVWHTDAPAPVPVSAEVLTLITDPPASRERFLRTAPDLPAAWFRDLSASLAALRAYPTDRRFPVHDAEEYGYLLSATYRRPVPAGCVPAFGTEHIDLNWENITAPRFCILDMEHWRVAVTGYGAAASAAPGAPAHPGCRRLGAVPPFLPAAPAASCSALSVIVCSQRDGFRAACPADRHFPVLQARLEQAEHRPGLRPPDEGPHGRHDRQVGATGAGQRPR
jgi:hypothetical protein